MIQKNILEYLEHTAVQVPDKLAYSDGERELNFGQVWQEAKAIGSFLCGQGYKKEPILIFMKRSPQTVAAFFGTIYSGCFYVPIDEEMPKARISLIIQNAEPRAVICDRETLAGMSAFAFDGAVYCYEDICMHPVDEKALKEVRDQQIDTDPIYIVFTSGSTGTPKGVTACHRSVIDYIGSLSRILKIDEDTVFGNQTPLYFDACLKEVIGTIMHGATTYLIPKSLFLFPIKLVEFMRQYQVNTVCWVSSALTMISGFKVLDKLIPERLHTIAFGSEVFPIKQYRMWKAALPQARFINLYGPTECTGMSCYYEVDREFALDEVIPIGRAFPNKEILLLDEANKPAAPGETGEICIRGTSLTMGYYRNPEKTAEVFVQNPLNDRYPELIYRTGDLAKYNERGELVFVSRKDYQIKHMGHRIELGEIEMNVDMMAKIRTSCCVYDDSKGKIVLYYVGEIDSKVVLAHLKEHLPRYMIPNAVRQLEEMPLMANGKINRVYLKELYTQRKRRRK